MQHKWELRRYLRYHYSLSFRTLLGWLGKPPRTDSGSELELKGSCLRLKEKGASLLSLITRKGRLVKTCQVADFISLKWSSKE